MKNILKEKTEIDEFDISSLLGPSIQELNEKLDLKRKDRINSILNTNGKYFYDDNPDETINRICVFFIHYESASKAKEKAKTYFEKFDFPVLYGHKENWRYKFDIHFDFCLKTFKEEKSKGHNTIFDFILQYDLSVNINKDDLIIPKNVNPQKININEVSYIYKKILIKLIDSKSDHVSLSRNYFLASIDDYKEKTGRKLSIQKISRITTILDKYKFINKNNIYNEKTKHLYVSTYSIGSVGFYVKKFKK